MTFTRRAGAVAALTIATLAIIPATSTTAASAPMPRVTAPQCAQAASPDTGYVVIDKSTNTTCVTKTNSTWVWSNAAATKRNKKVTFKGHLCPTSRGDITARIKVRFIRGNTVVKKWTSMRPGCTFTTNHRFTKKGTWTAVFSYRHSAITTKVKVT